MKLIHKVQSTSIYACDIKDIIALNATDPKIHQLIRQVRSEYQEIQNSNLYDMVCYRSKYFILNGPVPTEPESKQGGSCVILRLKEVFTSSLLTQEILRWCDEEIVDSIYMRIYKRVFQYLKKNYWYVFRYKKRKTADNRHEKYTKRQYLTQYMQRLSKIAIIGTYELGGRDYDDGQYLLKRLDDINKKINMTIRRDCVPDHDLKQLSRNNHNVVPFYTALRNVDWVSNLMDRRDKIVFTSFRRHRINNTTRFKVLNKVFQKSRIIICPSCNKTAISMETAVVTPSSGVCCMVCHNYNQPVPYLSRLVVNI